MPQILKYVFQNYSIRSTKSLNTQQHKSTTRSSKRISYPANAASCGSQFTPKSSNILLKCYTYKTSQQSQEPLCLCIQPGTIVHNKARSTISLTRAQIVLHKHKWSFTSTTRPSHAQIVHHKF